MFVHFLHIKEAVRVVIVFNQYILDFRYPTDDPTVEHPVTEHEAIFKMLAQNYVNSHPTMNKVCCITLILLSSFVFYG